MPLRGRINTIRNFAGLSTLPNSESGNLKQQKHKGHTRNNWARTHEKGRREMLCKKTDV